MNREKNKILQLGLLLEEELLLEILQIFLQ